MIPRLGGFCIRFVAGIGTEVLARKMRYLRDRGVERGLCMEASVESLPEI